MDDPIVSFDEDAAGAGIAERAVENPEESGPERFHSNLLQHDQLARGAKFVGNQRHDAVAGENALLAEGDIAVRPIPAPPRKMFTRSAS